jgi:hypothetical protein
MNISEADTRAKFIDPKIQKARWEDFVIREHYFTDGRKLIGGKRGRRLFVDYLLKYKNVELPIPSIERQNKAVERFETLSAKTQAMIKEQQDKLDNLKALKESILDKAFKGVSN